MRLIDLFSGCGGLSKGFENAGFEGVLAVEYWEPARKVYEMNFAHPVLNLDLSGVNEVSKIIDVFKPEIIVGGPPCQEFSIAGDRKEGARAELTINFANIIKNVRPKWFVMENVPRTQKSTTWETAKKILEEAGYGITETILNAAYYHVPQTRKRLFVIGRLGESQNFLLESLEEKKSQKALTIREYLGEEFNLDFYYRHPRNWGRRAIYSLDEPSPTIRATNRNVSPGYTAHHLDAGSHLVARALTPLERARIQTFDKSFKFFGSDTALNTMIANAVPVNLANCIALAIQEYEKNFSLNAEHKFREWLSSQHEYSPRTVSNVLSRLNRATNILRVNQLSSEPLNTIHSLERNDEFIQLSSSVKAQLKKAVRLRADFQKTLYLFRS